MMCGMMPTSIRSLDAKLGGFGFLLAQRTGLENVSQNDE